ncbi:MAG: hypothetical protein JWM74_3054 [Myxococcaceae bacterium]|nr:hypothetical protein [Myxococcaceae bacterium]
MDICQGCGLIAPTQKLACDACTATFSTPRMQAPPRTDDAYWAAVRCELPCRACGLSTPLNELDADGTVECARCGIAQAFAVREWAAVAEHAHDVGDLAGPDPCGRAPNADLAIGADNPFKTTGIKHSAAAFGGPKKGRVDVLAGPGHPLCKKCHAPLEMRLDAVAHKQCRATATCPQCNEATIFDLPKSARAAYPALKAIIADGNRADCKHVVFQPGAGGQAVVVRCPNCNADLPPLEPDARHVTCTYCKVAAFIPARAWARQGAPPPPAQMWWMLFRGPSPARVVLEGLARAAHAREQGKKNDAANRARQSEERARDKEREAAERAAKAVAAAEVAEVEEAAQATERKRDARMPYLLAALVVGVLAVIIVAVTLGNPAPPTSAPRSTGHSH